MMRQEKVRIISRPLLRDRTTMRLGGEAFAEILVPHDVRADELLRAIDSFGGPVKVLGEGSNLLVSDLQLPFILLRHNAKDAQIMVIEHDDAVELIVPAGMRLPGLLVFAAKHGFSGLEGLCGIPGSVGGAVRMNAGSYGMEIGNVLQEISIVTPGAGQVVFSKEELGFTYRTLRIAIQNWYFITSVRLLLTRKDQHTIRAAMRENYKQKQATQPVTAWSAGCVFKNPEQGISAGKLLDMAGFRGKSLGGMQFSEKHANFLINTGSGSFVAAKDLLTQAQETIKNLFGYSLELEVQIWE